MLKRTLLLTLALAVVATTAAAQTGKTGHDHAAAAMAPAFSLPDQDGRGHNLADYAGKIVVLEWLNPECPFVKFHGGKGTMRTLAEKYKGQGVVWLAVNSTKHGTRDADRAWIAEQKLPYPVLEDFDGKVGRAYGAKTTPHMFVIGRDGALAYQGAIDDDNRIQGAPKTNYVEAALAALVAGQPVATAQTTPYGCSVKYKE